MAREMVIGVGQEKDELALFSSACHYVVLE
jgi:hypothetical protein